MKGKRIMERNINIIHVTTEDLLNELKNDSALTWEGMTTTDDNLNDIFNWIEAHTEMKEHNIFITTGKFMNETLHLTGSNQYPDDLSIVSIKLSDMKNPQTIVIPRFEVGGRWMDDIISNNLSRERDK